MDNNQSSQYTRFINQLERVRKHAPNGVEYWAARELQSILGYTSWEKFENVISKARAACEGSGSPSSHHFHQSVNKVSIGSGAERERADCKLSRYACYLIAMNGDSTKPEIGFAQSYFAIQTRRQELHDESKRLTQRLRVIAANQHLKSAAARSGVERYPLFHDAGYRGLYGGRGVSEIKRYKRIAQNEDLLDRAGRAELAANEYRITQTEQKLVREAIKGEANAIEVHRTVGKEVRESIMRLGGTLPENLPAEPSIKRLVAKHRRDLPGTEQPDVLGG